jgi:hypothetical protein
MNSYLLGAAALAFVVGLIHSILGEHLIFRRIRHKGLVPTDGGSVLREPHVRIQWANWHITTAMGWGMAAVLFWLGTHEAQRSALAFIEQAIVLSMLASSVLVLVGTQAKHPGWIGLLGVALLVAVA